MRFLSSFPFISNFSVCAAAGRIMTREEGRQGGADVVPHVRESALSSWHTARDRAMNRTIARTLEEDEKEEKEDRNG